jgi:transposase
MGSQLDWDGVEKIDELGLDEIALRKGHKNFVVIVSARVKGQIMLLGILKDRKKETVKEFLRCIPNRLRVTIKVVCCDMYEGFINAVKEVLGKIKITIDRFHVAKHYRKSIEKLRKKELKRLKKGLNDAEYKQLKGAMWALRKENKNLTEQEQLVLMLLFTHSPSLKVVYDFQNELTAIFNMVISKEEAIVKIKDWINRIRTSDTKDFDPFIQTLEHSWDEILNYFDGRANSGFVEGLNNKIKVLKRRCYGIFNLKHLFQRISLDLKGYEMFA